MAGKRKQRGQPDFSLEGAAGGRLAGVDEAGRGPWAGGGPAAVVLSTGELSPQLRAAITDSKLLTAERRAALQPAILACADTALGIASVAEIDSMNILQATLLAMRRAVARLAQAPDMVLVDGNRAPRLPVGTVVSVADRPGLPDRPSAGGCAR